MSGTLLWRKLHLFLIFKRCVKLWTCSHPHLFLGDRLSAWLVLSIILEAVRRLYMPTSSTGKAIA